MNVCGGGQFYCLVKKTDALGMLFEELRLFANNSLQEVVHIIRCDIKYHVDFYFESHYFKHGLNH